MAQKIGYVLGSPVLPEEQGKNTGYWHCNPPANSVDRSSLHITNAEGNDFCKVKEKPFIGKFRDDLYYHKTFIDNIYKAVLTDEGDDILYLLEEAKVG